MTATPKAMITQEGFNVELRCPVVGGFAVLTHEDIAEWPEVLKFIQRFPDSWRRDPLLDLWRCAVDSDAEDAGEAVYFIRAEKRK